MINIAICDDNDFFCGNLISFFLKKYPDILGALDDFSNGEELLQQIRGNNIIYDFIFLDIDMPVINGIETGMEIRKSASHLNATIIYITAYDYPPTAITDIHPYAYMMKPVNFSLLEIRFEQLLKKCLRQKNEIILSVRKNTYRFYARDILYIEAGNHQSVFHLLMSDCPSDTCPIKICFSRLWPMLSDRYPQFCRIHHSYIVNLSYIEHFTSNQVTLTNHMTLPISKSHKASFTNDFLKFYRI